MMKKGSITLTAGVGIATAIIGAWIALDPWPVVGWVTPQQAKIVHENLKELHASEEQGLKEFRDEWKCDEYDEELLAARADRDRARADGRNTTELDHLIEKIKEAMRKLDCSRFEDFG